MDQKYQQLFAFCTSQSTTQILHPLTLTQQPKSCLNRAYSQYFSTSKNFNDGDATPTMSERKKSVSFSENLEEVRYIENCKSVRNKSSDGLKRRRQNTDRQQPRQVNVTKVKQDQNIVQKKDMIEQYFNGEYKSNSNIGNLRQYFTVKQPDLINSGNIQQEQNQHKPQQVKRLGNENMPLAISNEPLHTIAEVQNTGASKINNSFQNTHMKRLQKLQKKYQNVNNYNQNNSNQLPKTYTNNLNSLKQDFYVAQKPLNTQNKQTNATSDKCKLPESINKSINDLKQSYKTQQNKDQSEKLSLNKNKFVQKQQPAINQSKVSPRASPIPDKFSIQVSQQSTQRLDNNKSPSHRAKVVKETKSSFLKKAHTDQIYKTTTNPSQSQSNSNVDNSFLKKFNDTQQSQQIKDKCKFNNQIQKITSQFLDDQQQLTNVKRTFLSTERTHKSRSRNDTSLQMQTQKTHINNFRSNILNQSYEKPQQLQSMDSSRFKKVINQQNVSSSRNNQSKQLSKSNSQGCLNASFLTQQGNLNKKKEPLMKNNKVHTTLFQSLIDDNDMEGQDNHQSKYIVEPPVLATSYSYIIRKEKIEARHKKINDERRLKQDKYSILYRSMDNSLLK